MKNALISPIDFTPQYISGWTNDTPPEPIYSDIQNSYRVAEVADQTFEVSPALFWVECDNDVKADYFYYNTLDKEIYPIPDPAPKP